MVSNVKPGNCPEYIRGICPICGLVSSGYGPHPNAEGVGIENVLKRAKKLSPISEEEENV